jgi:hypothetical protein
MSRTRLAALAFAAIALAPAGCGGSTKSSTPPKEPPVRTESRTEPSSHTKPLSRAQLIARADAICGKINAKRAEFKIRTRRDYATVYQQFASYAQGQIAELSKITPPASMASGWRQILADAQSYVGGIAKISGYIRSNNDHAARALDVPVFNAQEQMATIAKHNGFKDCARH